MMWSGSVEDIPNRWILSDGSNGTPDLRDKFVIGAGGSFAVDAAGGNALHNHTFTSNLHQHDITTVGPKELAAGTDILDLTTQNTVSGTVDNKTERPPYYALCYIMYVGSS